LANLARVSADGIGMRNFTIHGKRWLLPAALVAAALAGESGQSRGRNCPR
jgi:hypothetical protein